MRFVVRIECRRCGAVETIVSANVAKSVSELALDAFQADQTRINPLFKFPLKVVPATKAERNWVRVALCKNCRDAWAVLEASINEQINDFRNYE